MVTFNYTFARVFSLIIHLSLFSKVILAQSVGIGTTTPDATSILDIQSSNKGILIPRLTASQRNGIVAPANGLMVYDTDFNSLWYFGTGQWLEVGTSYALKSVNIPANFTAVPLNTRRYIWELNSSFPVRTTLEIPLYIISDLCGDDDGCDITLTMTNWQVGDAGTNTNSLVFKFFYNPSTNYWRVGDGTVFSGLDGNTSPETIGLLSNNIYFTDGTFTGGTTGTDSVLGFGLMKWTAFPSYTIGRLIMED